MLIPKRRLIIRLRITKDMCCVQVGGRQPQFCFFSQSAVVAAGQRKGLFLVPGIVAREDQQVLDEVLVGLHFPLPGLLIGPGEGVALAGGVYLELDREGKHQQDLGIAEHRLSTDYEEAVEGLRLLVEHGLVVGHTQYTGGEVFFLSQTAWGLLNGKYVDYFFAVSQDAFDWVHIYN